MLGAHLIACPPDRIHLYQAFDWISFDSLDQYAIAQSLNRPLRYHACLTYERRHKAREHLDRILGTVGRHIFAINLIHECAHQWDPSDLPPLFEYARTLTDADLFLGDYRRMIGEPAKWRHLLELAEWLKPYGCAGLSVQLHRHIERPFPAFGLEWLIDSVQSRGLQVSFDEVQVMVAQRGNHWTEPVRYQVQASHYLALWEVARKYAVPFGIWWPFDAVPHNRDRVVKSPPDACGLWSKGWTPKPAHAVFFGTQNPARRGAEEASP